MDEWHSQGIIDANQPIDRVIFRIKDKKQGKDLNLKCTVILFKTSSLHFLIILDIILFFE